MEEREYGTLYALEESYWWFRALRNVLLEISQMHASESPPRVLDAGCGTGMLISSLRTQGAEAFGFDLAAAATPYWGKRNLTTVCRASANAIPFPDASFDTVFAVDLVESDSVHEAAAVSELVRVLRPGGHLLLVVPAYRALMSPDHHRAVHASRRYTRRLLTSLVASAPVHVVRMTHLFLTLFVPIVAYRLWRRFAGRASADAKSELTALPAIVNGLLFVLTDWERYLIRRVDLPLGSSILAVLRRWR